MTDLLTLRPRYDARIPGHKKLRSATGAKTRLGGTVRSWYAMRTRCENPKAAARYKTRGITICERWRSFENFLADMGERPDGMTLDRIDNDGNYEPGNCRWATAAQQSNNHARNLQVTHDGVTLTLMQWSQRLGINYNTLRGRLQAGWPPERAFTTSPNPRTPAA